MVLKAISKISSSFVRKRSSVVGKKLFYAHPKADINPDIAYHGSPFSFDKFDVSKLGTGEGFNVYGKGIYLSRSKRRIPFYANIRSTDAPIHFGCTKKLPNANPTCYTVGGLKNLNLKSVSNREARTIARNYAEFEKLHPEIEGLELENQIVIFTKAVEKLNILKKQNVIDFVKANKNFEFATWTTDQAKLNILQ